VAKACLFGQKHGWIGQIFGPCVSRGRERMRILVCLVSFCLVCSVFGFLSIFFFFICSWLHFYFYFLVCFNLEGSEFVVRGGIGWRGRVRAFWVDGFGFRLSYDEVMRGWREIPWFYRDRYRFGLVSWRAF
jgi:hypothetical protein